MKCKQCGTCWTCEAGGGGYNGTPPPGPVLVITGVFLGGGLAAAAYWRFFDPYSELLWPGVTLGFTASFVLCLAHLFVAWFDCRHNGKCPQCGTWNPVMPWSC